MPRCKICDGETTKIEDNKKKLDYYRCVDCGFIYLDNSYIVDSKREKEHYDKHENGFDSLGYVEMFERFIDNAIEPYIEGVSTVLEFGCGFAPVLVELLKKKGLSVDKYDLYYFPEKIYENRTYDLITSTEVFEHLKEPLAVLQTLVNSLNPNGYIILMTKFPPLEDKIFLNWWYRRDITHISFFSPQSFEIMSKKVGLKMIKTIDNNIVVLRKC